MNINHLHLKVRSVDRARTFYERFFGLREFVWHDDILFLRDAAGMDLALAPTTTEIHPPEWFHLGFRLSSAADVTNLHDTLTRAGVAMRQPLISDEAFVSFRCADPDGYGVEVYWEPQPA